MGETLVKVFMSWFIMVVNWVTTPINLIIDGVFPDFADYIDDFYGFIDAYIVPNINYFFHLLPPNSMKLALLYLSILIICYTTTISVHAIIKLIEIIKNVKIW